MRDVEGLALGAVAVDVDEDHLGEQAALHEGEGRRGTDEAATDDGDLAIVHHVNTSFLPPTVRRRLIPMPDGISRINCLRSPN